MPRDLPLLASNAAAYSLQKEDYHKYAVWKMFDIMMVSNVKCHLSTTMTIFVNQFEDRCHISIY